MTLWLLLSNNNVVDFINNIIYLALCCYWHLQLSLDVIPFADPFFLFSNILHFVYLSSCIIKNIMYAWYLALIITKVITY